MTRLPEKLLGALEGIQGFDKENFVRVHQEELPPVSIRINPAKTSKIAFENISNFPIVENVKWADNGLYLQMRPSFTFDPLFHAGCYYVQEASSMFLEQAMKQLTNLSKPMKVLDLCAAPGGKSTHLQSLLSSDSLLVSNEVIKSRSNILTDNIVKWGAANVIVTNNDPVAFKKLEGFFDVIVVDAPCSGSGLFRKDEKAIGEWSSSNVQLCCQRQQRILADILPALRENGLLIYSTCSYSKEEDEDIAEWLEKTFEMRNEKLVVQEEWNVIETEYPQGYRFFPDKVAGEGFFMACFRKKEIVKEVKWKPPRPEQPSIVDKQIIQGWLKGEDVELLKRNDQFFALPVSITNDYCLLKTFVNIQYSGTVIGRIMKNRLVPEHALALSPIISEQIPVNEVNFEDAILFLQKKELLLKPADTGWQLISYKGYLLGWINALPNRINNYYPKELRILKDSLSAS